MIASVVTIIILQRIMLNFNYFLRRPTSGPPLDPSQLTSLTVDTTIQIDITLQRVYSLTASKGFL
jgi:hypothetical protein